MGKPGKKANSKTKSKQGQKALSRDNKLNAIPGFELAELVQDPLGKVLEHKEAKTIWDGLDDHWRIFFATWLVNGYNRTRAYLTMKPEGSYETARTEASRMLKDPRIIKLKSFHKLDVESIINHCNDVELELIEHPDPEIRLKAAKQLRDHMVKYLPKVGGDTPPEGSTTNIQNNFILSESAMEAVKGILNG